MAINQASFFLFAPRFGPAVELDRKSKTIDGSPVRIVDSQMMFPRANIVRAGQAKTWFEHRGFFVSDSYGSSIVITDGFAETSFGKQETTQLSLPAAPNEEIDCLYIRFLLELNKPPPIEKWEELIQALGDDFQFRLMTPDSELTSCSDFRTILEMNSNFQMFNKSQH